MPRRGCGSSSRRGHQQYAGRAASVYAVWPTMGESCLGDCNQATPAECRGVGFFTASGLVGFGAWVLVLSALTLRVPYLTDAQPGMNSSSNGTGLLACLQPSMWTRVMSTNQTIDVMCIDGSLRQVHIPPVSPSTATSNSMTAVAGVAGLFAVIMSFGSAQWSSWASDKKRVRSCCGGLTTCLYLVLSVLCVFYWLYRIWACGGKDPVEFTKVRNPFGLGCFDGCHTAADGVCDDGGPIWPGSNGNSSGTCPFGTDCTDCGTRVYPTTIPCSEAITIHEQYMENVEMGPTPDNRRATSFECYRILPGLRLQP